ncbi:MAG: hypothetical protein WAV78_12650, partial [Xanthobacteraceae bacterium]
AGAAPFSSSPLSRTTNLSSGDEVPHIFTRNSRVQPKEILITSAKRLLQQNLPQPDVIQKRAVIVHLGEVWPVTPLLFQRLLNAF